MTDPWDNLPLEFQYLVKTAKKYVPDDLGDVATLRSQVDAYTAQQVEELTALADEIQRRSDSGKLYKWGEQHSRVWRSLKPKDRGPNQDITNLFGIFSLLAKKYPEPFQAVCESYDAPRGPVDWADFPTKYRFLIPFAEKYGEIQFDHQIDEFVENISTEQRKEFEGIACLMQEHVGLMPVLEGWLDRYTPAERAEVALVRWAINLLVVLGLW